MNSRCTRNWKPNTDVRRHLRIIVLLAEKEHILVSLLKASVSVLHNHSRVYASHSYSRSEKMAGRNITAKLEQKMMEILRRIPNIMTTYLTPEYIVGLVEYVRMKWGESLDLPKEFFPTMDWIYDFKQRRKFRKMPSNPMIRSFEIPKVPSNNPCELKLKCTKPQETGEEPNAPRKYKIPSKYRSKYTKSQQLQATPSSSRGQPDSPLTSNPSKESYPEDIEIKDEIKEEETQEDSSRRYSCRYMMSNEALPSESSSWSQATVNSHIADGQLHNQTRERYQESNQSYNYDDEFEYQCVNDDESLWESVFSQSSKEDVAAMELDKLLEDFPLACMEDQEEFQQLEVEAAALFGENVPAGEQSVPQADIAEVKYQPNNDENETEGMDSQTDYEIDPYDCETDMKVEPEYETTMQSLEEYIKPIVDTIKTEEPMQSDFEYCDMDLKVEASESPMEIDTSYPPNYPELPDENSQSSCMQVDEVPFPGDVSLNFPEEYDINYCFTYNENYDVIMNYCESVPAEVIIDKQENSPKPHCSFDQNNVEKMISHVNDKNSRSFKSPFSDTIPDELHPEVSATIKTEIASQSPFSDTIPDELPPEVSATIKTETASQSDHTKNDPEQSNGSKEVIIIISKGLQQDHEASSEQTSSISIPLSQLLMYPKVVLTRLTIPTHPSTSRFTTSPLQLKKRRKRSSSSSSTSPIRQIITRSVTRSLAQRLANTFPPPSTNSKKIDERVIRVTKKYKRSKKKQ
jgi:hypothetical protein